MEVVVNLDQAVFVAEECGRINRLLNVLRVAFFEESDTSIERGQFPVELNFRIYDRDLEGIFCDSFL